MIRIVTITIFLFTLSASGQSADSIQTIIIDYGRNHGSWGDPGIYAQGETIELTKTITGAFRIYKLYRINASAGKDGKTFQKDTIYISTSGLKLISKEKIDYWLTQLKSKKENFTPAFIKPFLKPPNRKEIFGVAKKYDQIWVLKGSDADKSDTRNAFRNLHHFNLLDSFLVYKKPTIEFDMIVMDSYNGLKILTITSKNDTSEYRCQFYQPLGQPIVRYIHKNYLFGSNVFNLEANTSALSFLPPNSMTAKALDLNNLKELYIKWYLEKGMFK